MSKPEIPQSLKTSVEASRAEYVNLGKSGLRVSIPIFGAMSFGDPEWAPWVIDEEKVIPYSHCHYPVLFANEGQITPPFSKSPTIDTFVLIHYNHSLFPSSKPPMTAA